MDEQMSSVILTSHMYGTNTVQDDRGGGVWKGVQIRSRKTS